MHADGMGQHDRRLHGMSEAWISGLARHVRAVHVDSPVVLAVMDGKFPMSSHSELSKVCVNVSQQRSASSQPRVTATTSILVSIQVFVCAAAAPAHVRSLAVLIKPHKSTERN